MIKQYLPINLAVVYVMTNQLTTTYAMLFKNLSENIAISDHDVIWTTYVGK